MPQYQGGFYTGKQAAGDVLREVLQGIARGRDQSLQAREQRRLEEERQQLRSDRLEERSYLRGRDAKADARQSVLDGISAMRTRLDFEKEGVFEGQAPTNIAAPVDFSGLGGVGRAFVQNPTRYQPFGEGYYRDDAKTPETKARVLADTHRQAIERIVTRLSSGDRSAAGAAAAAGLNPNDYDPAKTPGTAQYIAAKKAELELQDTFDARQQRRQVAGQLQVAGARATQDARAGSVPKLGDVLQFRTQYAGDPTVKAATEVASSVAVARKAAAGGTGVSDVSLVYAAAKAMDPNSVVREGEFATIEKSQSVSERIKSLAFRAGNGDRLTPQMRAELVKVIEDRGEVARQALQPVRQRFTGMAQTYGLPLDQTVYDPFDGLPAVKKPSLSYRDVTELELRPR